MVDNIQAVASVKLHHAQQLADIYGNETIEDIIANMKSRLGTAQLDYQYNCPKCKGKGTYLPSVDDFTIPNLAPISNNILDGFDGPGIEPAQVTCSICAGEGKTSVQVYTNASIITYSNTPTP